MNTAQSVTTTGLANNAQNTATSRTTLAEDFDQFLTLLTTQLQNQDPLAPMDSSEFTNQLVQFSQVEQQINLNQKIDDLLTLQLSSISSVALGYVGMDISYLSAEMNFDGANPVKINYSLATPGQTAKINVRDEAGQLVFSGDVPKDAGRNEFTWNGLNNAGQTVPLGTYSVKIGAVDKDQKPIQASTAVSGHVKGIESQNGIVYVLVGDRAVAISSILQARVPNTPAPTGTGA